MSGETDDKRRILFSTMKSNLVRGWNQKASVNPRRKLLMIVKHVRGIEKEIKEYE